MDVERAKGVAAPAIHPQRLSVDRREIRLLSIHPGLGDDGISGSLRTVSLDDKPIYIALSYAWGDPGETKPIKVNGQTLPITVNLEAACRRFQRVPMVTEIWIDAICINQKDLVERNEQVALMRPLYTGASQVIIWLGEGDMESDMLAEILTSTGLPIKPKHSLPDYHKEFHNYQKQWIRTRSLVLHLCDRAWWSRVWCVQECVLPINAPIFYCGERSFTWTQFFNTFEVLFDETLYDEAAFLYEDVLDDYTSRELAQEVDDMEQILALCSVEAKRERSISMLTQLERARNEYKRSGTDRCINNPLKLCCDRSASVAHDYIYGFLSLFPDKYRRLITVDYQIPHWHLYQEIMSIILSEGQEEDFSFLSSISFTQSTRACPPGTESQSQLSWVPNFTEQRYHDMNNSSGLANVYAWRLPKVRWSDDESILMPQGVYLDIVDDVVGCTESDQNDFRQELIVLEQAAKSVVDKSGSGRIAALRDIVSQQSLYRFFTCRSRHRDIFSLFNDDVQDLMWEVMMGRKDEADLAAQHHLDGHTIQAVTTEIEECANAFIKGRKLITTEHGFVGISIPNVQKGDAVTFLYGFPMAMILRPGPYYYTIVGGACVHGLVDWTVLDNFHDKGLLPQAVFRIR